MPWIPGGLPAPSASRKLASRRTIPGHFSHRRHHLVPTVSGNRCHTHKLQLCWTGPTGPSRVTKPGARSRAPGFCRSLDTEEIRRGAALQKPPENLAPLCKKQAISKVLAEELPEVLTGRCQSGFSAAFYLGSLAATQMTTLSSPLNASAKLGRPIGSCS